MTPLRQRMIDDMRLRHLSPHTVASYLGQVTRFAAHFGRSPETLGPEDIRTYQVHLTTARRLSVSSVLIAVAALRFLYKVTLRKDWRFDEFIPLPKKPQTLPVVLSPEEVQHFLACVVSVKHRTILTVCYAGGLRISEVVRLRIADIDSQRMVLRIEQGKGQKDRYVMLSSRLLTILRDWWRREKPTHWLFPGEVAGAPVTRSAVERVCQHARRRSGIAKPITPHSLRHAFAVHLLESGTNVRTIQLLLGHRSLATTARYLRIATSSVCATPSPFDLLPCPPPPPESAPVPPPHF